MTDLIVNVGLVLLAIGILALVAGLIVLGGSWWERRDDPLEPVARTEGGIVVGSDAWKRGEGDTAWIVDECGAGDGPILSSDSACTFVVVDDSPEFGAGASAATYHPGCCPDPEHEHGTIRRTVRSAP